ncbi:uncharacterized protein BDV17DRAFT_277506 [Aspergillus undulatus]|uniref:uncharacterized protein n=1 Tax=Aspergillus undulatus TaxID=1810928 RepID=UPI003CCD5926
MDTTADEDTRHEVNLLILDYMLCMAIHTAMHATKSNTNGWDMTWLEDTIRALRTGLAAANKLPIMLLIKAQVFEIISILKDTDTRPSVLAEMASGFLFNCKSVNSGLIEAQATTAAVQLCAHAVSRAHRILDDHAGENPARYAPTPSEGEKPGNLPVCVAKALPTMGISAEAVYNTSQSVHIHDTIKSLFDTMQLLPPPVLLQLERGKLDGLSRAETQELKYLAGMG